MTLTAKSLRIPETGYNPSVGGAVLRRDARAVAPCITFETWNTGRVCIVEPGLGQPRAQIVFTPGLSEHAGRPIPFARELARHGFRTLIVELDGHGAPLSAPRAAQRIYEIYASGADTAETLERVRQETVRSEKVLRHLAEQQYGALKSAEVRRQLRQIASVGESAQRLHPSLPIFFVGHSMGGLLSLEAAWQWSAQGEGDLRGVVLLSPALDPMPPKGNPLETLFLRTAWTLRDVPLSPTRNVLKGLMSLNLPIDTTSGNRWVSDLPGEVALYASDLLVQHRLPTRYLSSVESQMAATRRRGADLPVPGLVIVPARDGITRPDAGVALARAVQRSRGPESMRLVQVAGICAHDLLRSSAAARVTATITNWLDHKLRPSGVAA